MSGIGSNGGWAIAAASPSSPAWRVASATFVLALLMATHMLWAALVMMMARLGYPVVKIGGIRNLWGQLASLALGLSLTPTLEPTVTAGGLGFVLVGIAIASAILSAPIVILVHRLWDEPAPAATTESSSLHRTGLAIVMVLTIHLVATATIATAGKLVLGTIARGMALATLSEGRIWLRCRCRPAGANAIWTGN